MLSSAFVFTAALLVVGVHAQTDCSIEPSARPCDCCPARPNFLTPELAQECGLPPPPPQDGTRPSGPPPSGSRPPGPPDGKRGMSCDAVKCIYNKFNLLTGDKVNREAFAAFYPQQYGPEWASAIRTVVSTCNSEVDPNTSDCEPKRYFHCIKTNVAKNCLDSVWVQSAECNILRPYLQNCPMPGPRG